MGNVSKFFLKNNLFGIEGVRPLSSCVSVVEIFFLAYRYSNRVKDLTCKLHVTSLMSTNAIAISFLSYGKAREIASPHRPLVQSRVCTPSTFFDVAKCFP